MSKARPSAQILKTFWRPCADRIWAVRSMKGISVEPKNGSLESDFHEIDENIFLEQPDIIGTINYFLGESIVPIVAIVPREGVLRCIGTGYFVSCSGLLITAAHVITYPIDRKYARVNQLDKNFILTPEITMGVMIPNNPIFSGADYVFHAFEWAYVIATPREDPLNFVALDLKAKSDVAICKVVPRTNGSGHQPLSLIQPRMIGTGIKVGSEVTAFGYPLMEDMDVDIRGREINLAPMNGKFRLHMSRGKIDRYYPNNFIQPEVPTPGPCFSFTAKIPGGMSGGPIFDREGIYAHGVVSKGWEDASGYENFSFGCMLAPSMSIRLPVMGLRSLFELQQSSNEGMAKFSGPDL